MLGAIRRLIANRLSAFSIDASALPVVAKLAIGLSHAEICRACDESAKNVVLNDLDSVSVDILKASISGIE